MISTRDRQCCSKARVCYARKNLPAFGSSGLVSINFVLLTALVSFLFYCLTNSQCS